MDRRDALLTLSSIGLAAMSSSMATSQAQAVAAEANATAAYRLKLRSRSKAKAEKSAQPEERTVDWEPRQTAIIVCDMWDRHWCRSAERRVGEFVGPINTLLCDARERGSFILHAPSSVTSFYDGTPQRKRAQSATFHPTPVPLATSPRWGTAWCWTDGMHEGVLPIDDSDMGCDCAEPCPIEPPWTRQHEGIELFPQDALTDNGQETWNLLQQQGIRHVLICGVHLNMCVLGRPFGIRQLVKLGVDIVLLRDLTDTMYNPARPPGVTHFAGTERMIQHVETFWCPSCESSDLTGRPAFRFRGADA